MFIEFVKGEKYPAKDAPTSKRLEGFEDAGYVLKDTDLVIDIDCLPKETIRQMLETFNIRCEVVWTDRGAHLYFHKPPGFKDSEGITPLGFRAEFKHCDNTKAVTVKRNGVARERENVGKRPRLPEVLTPNRHKFTEVLLGLDGNDTTGRNSSLYSWTSKVYGYKDRDLILSFINRHIFAVPLPDSEFAEATRPRTPKAVKDMEGEIADCIIRDLNVSFYSGQVYFLDRDLDEYSQNIPDLEYTVYQYCKGQKSRYVDEVMKQLKMRCPRIKPNDGFPIALDNGYLKDGAFVPMIYRDFTPYRIHSEYDPDTPAVECVDDYLDQLTGGDADYRKRLLEAIAHGLITNKERKRMLGKFFIFVGDGGNGKGTLLQVIRKIFGEKNCGALSVKELQDERYFNTLSNKLVNLGDDLEDVSINQEMMRRLKNISTCDTIEVRRLYENSTTMEITSTLIFTSNHLIKSFEKGESYKRRVNWMPMFIKPKKRDPLFITKLTTPEALRYWVKLIVEAYIRLYENGFTESSIVSNYTANYHYENDNTIPYIDSMEEREIFERPTNDIYLDYESWCTDNGENPGSRKRLYENISRRFGVRKVQRRLKGYGRPVYVFEKTQEV